MNNNDFNIFDGDNPPTIFYMNKWFRIVIMRKNSKLLKGTVAYFSTIAPNRQ